MSPGIASSHEPAAPGPPPATIRLWAGYVLGFALLCAMYGSVFLATSPTPISPARALLYSAVNVVPHAVLGVAVIAACRRLPLPGARRRRLAATQVALAALYALGSTAITSLLFLVLRAQEQGRFEWRWPALPVATWQIFEGFLLYALLASVTYTLATLERLRQEEARAARAAELGTRAELRALRAQLDPHFLFNTLHTLAALVRAEPVLAEEAIERLGDLLRYVLRSQREGDESVTLGEEWAFVRDYLALEQLRLGERLAVAAELAPEALATELPPFSLQPLVENAIRHAIAPRAGGGRLRIAAELTGGELRIEVGDDGPGADPAAVAAAEGLGLRLVRQRLETVHGARARVTIDTRPGAGFRVELRIPARAGAARA